MVQAGAQAQQGSEHDIGQAVALLADRAATLARLKREAEALAIYQRLLDLQPNHQGALNESGGLNLRLGRPQAALACYDRALTVEPRAELYVDKGTALRALNRDAEALESFAAACSLKPDLAEARWNASLVRLRQGDFVGGWKDYEWRWRQADWQKRSRNFSAPLWLGHAPLAGKTILLHAEQGFGDAIQFARYAPLVAQRGAKVILECPAELTELFRDVEGVAEIIARGDALPAFDCHCPLLSLPLAFGTTLTTVPAKIPYLTPRTTCIAKWRRRLPRNGRLRVGICWAGGGEHLNDRRRSIPLDRFASILSVPGLNFVSLQKELNSAQAAILRSQCVVELGRQFVDFADTAAVISMVDLIICVDTAVAHLAGAMGKAAVLLLPFSPDFRWLLDRSDSPWYPTMRLFRQSESCDWGPVIDRVRTELAEVARGPAIHRG